MSDMEPSERARIISERDNWKRRAEERIALRREIEELLGIPDGPATDDSLSFALQILRGMKAANRTPSDPEKARAQFGAGLIRVQWEYVEAAMSRPELRHVCTWADGDEGFVFRETEPPEI